MKTIVSALVLILAMTLFAGGSNTDIAADLKIENASTYAIETCLIYSNLIDQSSQREVSDRLKKADIPEQNVDILLNWINDYNEHMGKFDERDLAYMDKSDFFNYVPGFIATDDKVVQYGKYYHYMKKWYGTRDTDDVLCRITAFELLKNMISVSDCIDKSKWDVSENNGWLVSDKAAFDTNPLVNFTRAEQDAYFTLFNPITIQKDISEDTSIEALFFEVSEEWNKRGISFGKGNASLITIWTMDESKPFRVNVSHAGVLIEDSEGLLFIEKTNPLFPYQATKFASREQLKTYMTDSVVTQLNEYNLDIPPMFVMENNSLM